jgi:hypothetical protein
MHAAIRDRRNTSHAVGMVSTARKRPTRRPVKYRQVLEAPLEYGGHL